MFYELALDGTVIYANQSASETLGIPLDRLGEISIVDLLDEEGMQTAFEEISQMVQTGQPSRQVRYNLKTTSGVVVPVESHGYLIEHEGGPPTILGVARNLTDQLQADQERQALQAQLQQATKMEAIGRLAGGVAHDFNNMLTAIMGNAGLGMSKTDAKHPAHSYLKQVMTAAERAADVTCQLLAFGRKQILEPKVLDLGDVPEQVERMLGRLIGEDIELTIERRSASAFVDPGQIEQVLVNLVINARDAMPDVGTITIRTDTVEIADAGSEAQHEVPQHEVPPGRYAMVSVRDQGQGMDRATQDKIFEPFFTTKEQGKGTGLGLAMVYGIVKQHGGFIEVSSAPELGTTFKLYFPLTDRTARRERAVAPVQTWPPGTETVALVEDDPAVRKLATSVLEQLGYKVFGAESGEQALDFAGITDMRIDLLLTDVVMPGINGKQLADSLCSKRPDLKVLFTSGYPDDVIAPHGVLENGLNFLAKPYSPYALARAVRRVLYS